jgi:hypothetical protein
LFPLPASQLLLMMPEPVLHAPKEAGVPSTFSVAHVCGGGGGGEGNGGEGGGGEGGGGEGGGG